MFLDIILAYDARLGNFYQLLNYCVLIFFSPASYMFSKNSKSALMLSTCMMLPISRSHCMCTSGVNGLVMKHV